MLAINAKVTRALSVGSRVPVCDNSGAKVIKITAIKGAKSVKGRLPSAGVGTLVQGSVIKGRPDMRKQVVFAVIVRQKKEYRRPDGMRISFADNALVVLKDDKGNPKGTIFKGAIAQEVTERWPAVAKVAKIVV